MDLFSRSTCSSVRDASLYGVREAFPSVNFTLLKMNFLEFKSAVNTLTSGRLSSHCRKLGSDSTVES